MSNTWILQYYNMLIYNQDPLRITCRHVFESGGRARLIQKILTSKKKKGRSNMQHAKILKSPNLLGVGAPS